MCFNWIETLQRENKMSQLIIRKIVRNILLETRGPLAFIPILKEWIKVAGKYGERSKVFIKGPPGIKYAKTACMQVPSEHADKVFDNSSPDLQEYILKHWRSKEYFAAMIEGVAIGFVKSYEKSNYMGMKSGTTSINGRINEDGEMVGSMSGYLTAKLENGTWQSNSRTSNQSSLLDFDGEIIRDYWVKELTHELKKRSGSTMVHEFQHWFQESVYYSQTGQMTPTKRGRSDRLPKPRQTNPNFLPLKPIQLEFAKRVLQGVDWNTEMKIKGATAYKLTNPQSFFDSYNPTGDKYSYSFVQAGQLAFASLSLAEIRDFIEFLAYDYLKLHKFLDASDLDTLATTTQNDYGKISRFSGFSREIALALLDKGVNDDTLVRNKKTGRIEAKYGYGNKRSDTPRSSDQETIMGTRDLLKSLGTLTLDVDILKTTDFDKKGNLKPNKKPTTPTSASSKKASWVVISRGEQRVPHRKPGSAEWDLERKRGIAQSSFGRPEWTDRWVEFDAVSSEFMVAEVLSQFEYRRNTIAWLVKGQSEKFAENLGRIVAAKVGARGFKHANRKPENRKHIQSLADRITDRLVETIEENPYEEWYDSNPEKLNKKNEMAVLPPQKYDHWVRNAGDLGGGSAPYGVLSYFKWIFRKASGENI